MSLLDVDHRIAIGIVSDETFFVAPDVEELGSRIVGTADGRDVFRHRDLLSRMSAIDQVNRNLIRSEEVVGLDRFRRTTGVILHDDDTCPQVITIPLCEFAIHEVQSDFATLRVGQANRVRTFLECTVRDRDNTSIFRSEDQDSTKLS